jgi:hypothetical protein
MSEQRTEPENRVTTPEDSTSNLPSETLQVKKSEASQPAECECPPGCVGLPCCT